MLHNNIFILSLFYICISVFIILFIYFINTVLIKRIAKSHGIMIVLFLNQLQCRILPWGLRYKFSIYSVGSPDGWTQINMSSFLRISRLAEIFSFIPIVHVHFSTYSLNPKNVFSRMNYLPSRKQNREWNHTKKNRFWNQNPLGIFEPEPNRTLYLNI